jgi:hypothetical protein
MYGEIIMTLLGLSALISSLLLIIFLIRTLIVVKSLPQSDSDFKNQVVLKLKDKGLSEDDINRLIES